MVIKHAVIGDRSGHLQTEGLAHHKILRAMPWGSVNESGSVFIGDVIARQKRYVKIAIPLLRKRMMTDGAVEVTAQVVLDDEGFHRKLKENLTDTALRAYLTKMSLTDSGLTGEALERVPEVITHAEAARYLRLSPNTLYNKREIPRLTGNKYRKEDLDRYLEGRRTGARGRM